MSKCQQFISAWMSMMFLLIVSVTGVGSVEALPAVAQVSYPAHLKEPATSSAPKMPYQFDPYLFYRKGVDGAELDRETQQITQAKQEVRRMALQREEEQRIRIESRGVEMAEFARFQKLRLGQRVAASAENFIGTQYVWGGTNPNQGFDCSGFTQYVLSTNGIKVPRNSYDQFAVGEAIPKAELEPGDLVFFSTYAPGPSHLGIYIGDGKFVHALNHNTGVITSKLDNTYYKTHFIGARRVL